MATFRVIAGDFGQSKSGQVLAGPLYRSSGQGFNMPINGHTFKTEHIGTGQIQVLEIATEESLKKVGGAIGWGIAAGLAFGAVGAIAGVLAGGNKKEVTFVCQFKDGRKFLGSCSPKTFTAIQSACFAAPATAQTKPQTHIVVGGVLLVLGCFLIAGLVLAAIRNKAQNNNGPETAQNPALNQAAVNFVAYTLTDDMQAALTKQQSVMGVEDALRWANLDRQISAANYDAAYEANEIAADNNFKGKRLLLSGTVDSIEKDFTDSSFLMLRGGAMGVRTELTKRGSERASLFAKGQKVNIVCKGSGRAVSIATANDCEMLGDYLAALTPSVTSRAADFLNGKSSQNKEMASMIAKMYVAGLSLPADSPCLNGKTDSCQAEITGVFQDKARLQDIQNRANQMMASLKVN